MDTHTKPALHEHKKNVGPIIVTLVIVLILIIGSLYIFASRMSTQTLPADALTEGTSTGAVKPITNKSDDIKSLQNDLKSATDGLGTQKF